MRASKVSAPHETSGIYAEVALVFVIGFSVGPLTGIA